MHSLSPKIFHQAPVTRQRSWRFNQEPLSSLSVEARIVFEMFGRGPSVEPSHKFLHHAIELQAVARPSQVAVRHLNESITYMELDTQAQKLAKVLRAHNVQQGEHVGLFLQRSIPMVVGILASLKCGAAYVPQDIKVSPTSKLEHVIEAANIRIVLTTSELREHLPAIDGVMCIEIDEIMKSADLMALSDQHDFFLSSPSSQDQTCYVLFTSGTTGKPNGVKVTHRNLCNVLLTAPGHLGIEPGMRVSQILNIAFDMAAWEIFGALCHGAELIIRGKSIQEAVEQADVVIATPSVLGSLDASACKNIKVAAVAGEPCPLPLAQTWGEFCHFYNCCGPTETTIINTMHLFDHHTLLTIGRPTPNNTVYVLRDDLSPCGIGEVGEMWAGGDCVTAGYLGNEELNADRYRPDPFLGEGRMMFRTRDLGQWTDQGELLHRGRTDDQVKVRGFRVELDSISHLLEEKAGFQAAVTLKLNDRDLVAFASPEGMAPDKALEIISQHLPYYCVPQFLETMQELPRTARGKVDKRALLARAIARQTEGGAL